MNMLRTLPIQNRELELSCFQVFSIFLTHKRGRKKSSRGKRQHLAKQWVISHYLPFKNNKTMDLHMELTEVNYNLLLTKETKVVAIKAAKHCLTGKGKKPCTPQDAPKLSSSGGAGQVMCSHQGAVFSTAAVKLGDIHLSASWLWKTDNPTIVCLACQAEKKKQLFFVDAVSRPRAVCIR